MLTIIIIITDLIGRMQTSDKISQIGHSAPAIESLNIPAYQWWSEALHGVAGSPGVHFGGSVCNFGRGGVCKTVHVFSCRPQLLLPSHK